MPQQQNSKQSSKKGSHGDFHNGVPNKHLGNKGDDTDQIRSSAERKRAQAAGLKPDQKGNTASPNAIPEDEVQ
jgi:hypothetical protein